MSNELEDFLRHTAEMRQRKTIEQRSEAAFQREDRTRSQYSDARRERQVGASRFDFEEMEPDELDLADDAIMAIPVQPGESVQPDKSVQPNETGRLRSVDAKIPEHVHREHRNHQDNDGTHFPVAGSADLTIAGLKEMLTTPQGLRQAFLLKEIFDRPKF